MKSHQNGNVLFLILIAVALFAALSYAVTKSSSGGGNATTEVSLIEGATINQYLATIQTSILRMNVTGGIAVEDIDFGNYAPSNASRCTSGADCIYATDGGGLHFDEQIELQNWGFAQGFSVAVDGVGTGFSEHTLAIMHAPNEKGQKKCQDFNENHNSLTTIPTEPSTFDGEIASTFSGIETGCFFATFPNKYVFYTVIKAR